MLMLVKVLVYPFRMPVLSFHVLCHTSQLRQGNALEEAISE